MIDRKIEIYLKKITDIPEYYFDNFYYAFGKILTEVDLDIKSCINIATKIPLIYKSSYYIGIGEGLGYLIISLKFDRLKYIIDTIAVQISQN